MTIDIEHNGTHILNESALCDLIDERDALAATQGELNSWAATLSLMPRENRTRAEQKLLDVCGKTLNATEAILAAHDAAKDAEIVALVKALSDTLAALPQDIISHTVWGGEGHDKDDGEIVYHPWYLAAKAALVPYKCGTCDGSETVFDDPSAPCPQCAGKEVSHAAE